MSKQTPIQEAINLLKLFLSDRATSDKYEHGKQVAYEGAISNLEALLPKEKEFAKDIWNEGRDFGYAHAQYNYTDKLSLEEMMIYKEFDELYKQYEQ